MGCATGTSSTLVPVPRSARIGRVAASAPLSLAVIKEVFAANETLGIADGYRLYRSGELEIYERMLKSEDAQEGPLAFTEKRPPVWKGR